MARARLGEVLVQAGLINEGQLRFALQAQAKSGARLGRILIDHHIVSEDAVIETLSRMAGLPRLDLARVQIDSGVVQQVSGVGAQWCTERGIVPLFLDRSHRTLIVAITDPTDLASLDELGFRSGAKTMPLLGSEAQIQHLIRHFFYGAPLDRLIQGGATPMQPTENMAALMDNPEILHNMNEIRDHLQGTSQQAFNDDDAISAPIEAASPFIEDLMGPRTTNTPPPPVRSEIDTAWAMHLAPLLDAQQQAAFELQVLFELCVSRGLIKRQEYLERLARIPD